MSQIGSTERFVSRLTRNTLALILAGGRGSRLKQLTEWRAKPAVPFGGKFRIIDFALSNCVNSGIRQIGVLTQYKADSLIRHLTKGWGFLRGEFGEYIDILPAQQRIMDSWYAGTADAVYQNLDIIRGRNPEFLLVLAGDHIYKMDYGAMLAYHVENNADLTVGCVEVSLEAAQGFGVMSTDEQYRISEFVEKPKEPKAMPGQPDKALVSMGIYVFNKGFLFEQLVKDALTPGSSRDFGKDIIPDVVGRYRVFAYPFLNIQTGVQSYWRDVGSLDSYWAANMELIAVNPELNLYDKTWPIWTFQEQTPPAKFVFNQDDRRGMAVDSMVSGGCIISGSKVTRSLLFSNVRVNSYSTIEDSVILPSVEIGRHCKLSRVIIDKGCKIPGNTVIGQDLELDSKYYHVTPGGVVLVTGSMLAQRPNYV
ncbi:MAG: glucose-1-phosphate adenylyltransferase [Gammaproteobacteria bacterium]